MNFRDRAEAGRALTERLKSYQGLDAVVFGLARGGVPVAAEAARALRLPLGVALARKIPHPFQPEYAIAAVSESGWLVMNESEVAEAGRAYLQRESERAQTEMARRRDLYDHYVPRISSHARIAILVDDGVATGLTLRAAIRELQHQLPAKVVVAVPIAPALTVATLEREADELVCLFIDHHFLGAVGAYYEDFAQLTDTDVIQMLRAIHDEHPTSPQGFSDS